MLAASSSDRRARKGDEPHEIDVGRGQHPQPHQVRACAPQPPQHCQDDGADQPGEHAQRHRVAGVLGHRGGMPAEDRLCQPAADELLAEQGVHRCGDQSADADGDETDRAEQGHGLGGVGEQPGEGALRIGAGERGAGAEPAHGLALGLEPSMPPPSSSSAAPCR